MPSPLSLSDVVNIAQGAVSALAAEVRALPPASATYRRTMPPLRRAASALGMSRDSVGDEPTLEDVRRAVRELNSALEEAGAGARRLLDAPARGLLGLDQASLHRAGEALRATVTRVNQGVQQLTGEWAANTRAFAGGLGSGLVLLVGALGLIYVVSNRR